MPRTQGTVMLPLGDESDTRRTGTGLHAHALTCARVDPRAHERGWIPVSDICRRGFQQVIRLYAGGLLFVWERGVNMKKRWRAVLAAVLIVLTVSLPFLALRGIVRSDAEPVYDEALIVYDGWTRTAGTQRVPVRMPAYVRPDADGVVTLTNTLPRVLSSGTYLAFRTYEAYAAVRIDGVTVWSDGAEPAGRPTPRWNYVRLEPEQAGKTIELELSGPDRFCTGTVSETLLGASGELMMYAESVVAPDRWINLSIIFTGLLVLLFSLVGFTDRESTARYFLLGLLILLTGAMGVCRITASYGVSAARRAVYDAVRASGGLIPPLYCLTCSRGFGYRRGARYRTYGWIGLACAVMTAALRAFGPSWLSPVLRAAGCLVFCGVFGVCLFSLRRDAAEGRSRNRVLLTVGIAALILGELAGTFTHVGNALRWALRPETLGALIFVLLETSAAMLSAYDQLERRMDMERELNDGKIRLMINQIRPHFINNVMTTIRSMIRYDPDEAEQMVYRFTQYLGYNIDALTGTELCPFSMELDHVRAYLEIEQAHLRPRLRVAYDVAVDDFEVPPLSVQPFVENAVRHGIAPKQGEGMLTISTEETQDAYLITVLDDGVGFDVTKPYDLRGGHGLGMNNAKERLAIMVKGTVDVASTPGEGTRVTITIPKLKEEDFDEDDIG